MQKFSVPEETPITEVLKKWLTAGSISVEGIYVPRTQCQRALVQFERWLTEDSGASWKETAEEMQRISSWQINMISFELNRAARYRHDIEDGHDDASFEGCMHEMCVATKDALSEVGK